MAYDRKTVDSTATDYNVSEIIADDLESNSIFVPIDSEFNMTFDSSMETETITLNANQSDISIEKRNKKGAIQLTSIVNQSLGSSSDSLNMRALKQTSKPNFTNDPDDSGTLAKDQDADIEVEMSDLLPIVESNNTSFTFAPVANLASNTVYFFNVTPDAKDEFGNPTTFTVGNGFVTDNSKSLILSSHPFIGHKVSLPTTNEDKFVISESIKKKDRVRPVATVIEHEEVSTLTYHLDPVNYYINVAFSATDPCVITTSSAHGLFSDNKITVYDIVSGKGLEPRVYNIASVTSDTITLDGIDTSSGTAGRLNFYVDFHAEDEIISLRPTIPQPQPEPIEIPQPPPLPGMPQLPPIIVPQEPVPDIDNNIQIKCESEPHIVKAELELNKEFSQFLPTGSSVNYGKSIRYDSDKLILNYVPVEEEGSNIISSTDNFANNIILEQETDEGTVRMYVRANTNPTQNVHPYHTSAPTVIQFVPDGDDAITRTLEVVEITRSDTTATVLTNSIHNLNVDDIITIEEVDQVAYNKSSVKVLSVPTPFSFTYEVTVTGNNPRSPATGDIVLKTGSSPATQATAIQLRFSQSMNTSTVTVANNTHIISADGTSAVFGAGEDKTTSTIQLSYDNFTNLVNCKSISANTGNTLFTIIPESLVKGKPYKFRSTTGVQDLGSTNAYQTYTTSNSFATGTKSFNPLTGKEVIFVDSKPPKIRKITLGSLVLESSNVQELSLPADLDDLAVNLGGGDSAKFSVQFNESMNISSVTVNTQNTDPFGTIQLSADDFTTVVQMSTTSPEVTTVTEKNDTFTFTPAYDLSAESNYILKVTKGVSDDAENENFLETDNVSSVKTMTVSDANGTFTTGEIIKGTRTMTVTSNTKAVTTGVTAGELILGTTSLAKGRIYDLTEVGGKIATLRYTEMPDDDGNVREFKPGEQVTTLTSDPSLITLANSSITTAPEGTVVTHSFGTNKLTYKEANSLNPFTAGSTSANDRVTGASSNVVAKSSVTTAITNSGITTSITALTATAYMRKQSDDSIVDIGAGAVTGIDVDSNVIIKFSQTMNADTIVVNSTDSRVRSTDTIIFSADNNFGNCIPLLPNPEITENGSRFEFKPVILANTSLSLTKGDRYDVKITRGAKTKGGSNTSSDVTESYAVIYSATYSVVNASVFDNNGEEIILGQYADTTVISANVSKSTPIIIHFSEVIDASTFASGAGNEIQLSTASNFGSGQIACTIQRSGRFGTQLTVIPNATLTAAPHYLRIIAGGTNEGSQALSATWQAGYFTTA